MLSAPVTLRGQTISQQVSHLFVTNVYPSIKRLKKLPDKVHRMINCMEKKISGKILILKRKNNYVK